MTDAVATQLWETAGDGSGTARLLLDTARDPDSPLARALLWHEALEISKGDARTGDYLACGWRRNDDQKTFVGWVARLDLAGTVCWMCDGKFQRSDRRPLGDSIVAAMLADGRVAVADEYNTRLVLLDGDSGSELGEVPLEFTPRGLAVDADGLLYVCDFLGHRSVVLSIRGAAATVVRTLGSHGSGPGQLFGPSDVCIDRQGNVLVADWRNSRVVVYSRDGTATHVDLQHWPMRVAVDGAGRLVVFTGYDHLILLLAPAAGADDATVGGVAA